MKRSKITDAFTGLEIRAVKMDDGSLVVSTPFDGAITMTYDETTDTYTIPASAFKLRKTMGLRECAEYLGVSRMRVSRMCSDGTLLSAKINGAMVIDCTSAQSIREKRIAHDRQPHALADVNSNR